MALKSYEELIKVDVRQYCEERDGFTYLNWAKCIELLRQNGATEVYWEPIPDPQTGSSLRKTDSLSELFSGGLLAEDGSRHNEGSR